MPSVNRNSLYGFLGFAIPALTVLVAYPVLAHGLGAAALGVYILATSISGTFALLDFGFSAATIKFIAEDMAKGKYKVAADMLLTSLIFYGVLGSLGALLIWFLSPWLAWVFAAEVIGTITQADVVWTFRLAAIQFAAFFLTTVFISLFKGMQRFDLSTLALSALSVLTYGSAIVGILAANVGLVSVTAFSMIANVLVLILSALMGLSLCRRHRVPLGSAKPTLATFKRMFGFGAIMTINSISGLLLYQIQRYLVGAFIGPVAVTIYVLAFTITSKAHATVNAVTEIMFPLASAIGDIVRLRRVYIRMLVGSGLIALLILLPFAILRGPILSFWVGGDLSEQVAPLIPAFALAFFFLALSPAPYHMINGIGRPGFNTLFFAINALINLVLIGLFALTGITLSKLAWAFAIANILTSLIFQTTVEIVIWRRGLRLPEHRIVGLGR